MPMDSSDDEEAAKNPPKPRFAVKAAISGATADSSDDGEPHAWGKPGAKGFASKAAAKKRPPPAAAAAVDSSDEEAEARKLKRPRARQPKLPAQPGRAVRPTYPDSSDDEA